MVIQVQPKEVDYDSLALRVFLKALEIIGGPRKIFEYRNLTWIPSLMEAAYAVVLKEEAFKTDEEIAEFIGITKQTVKNMLSADPDIVLKKLSGELESKEIKVHTAGGLAKLAYKEVKEGRDFVPFVISLCETYVSKLLGIAWPVEVLTAIKGMDFPIEEDKKEMLKERLSGINVKGTSAVSLVEKMEFPIKNPADLLHKLKEAAERT
ncbi:MAG: bacterio-opsin activator [Desulfurobacteriaceae bacterium]